MKEKLYNIILKYAKGINDIDCIKSDTNLIEDLNFDSVSTIQFIIELEEEFGITFNPEELDLKSIIIVGNVIQILKRKIDDEKNQY